MKKTIKIILSVLVFSLIMSITVFAEPGFAYKDEELTEFSPKWSKIQADDTVISVTPGAAVGELRFAWLSSSTDSNPIFKVSENSNMSDDEEYEVITAEAVENLRSNKVTVTGLEQGKTYYYSYTENGVLSEAQPFTVQPADDFTVLYISDAQIGRSGDETLEEILIRDTCGWN